MQQINSIEELKRESLYDEQKGFAEFFILLAVGFRSSKRIAYFAETETFDVHNEIDDSYQFELSETELESETHIVLAIEKGALFKYGY